MRYYDWETQEPGDLIVGRPWNNGYLIDGELPKPILIHRFAEFDNMGLVIAMCGLDQEHRSNSWTIYIPNYYQLSQGWPPCDSCFSEEGTERDPVAAARRAITRIREESNYG